MPLEDVSTNDPHVAAHNLERDTINALEQSVAGKITKPANPAVGDVLRWTGTAWGVSAIRLFEGVGSPQGVVAAPTGSRYRDTAATNGAVEWVKVSGTPTDNTGWLLVAGDTGWINIAAKIATRSSATIHAAQLRRVNNVVDLYIDMTMPNNDASPYNLCTLDVGFRPDFSRSGALQDNKEGAASSTLVSSAGVVQLSTGVVKDKRDRWNGMWTTQEPWPADLTGA